MESLLYLFILAIATMATANFESLLHNGNNKLSARMFTEVVKENPDKSFILSAYSVLTPLAQLALASVGESHDELLEAIGMPDDDTTKETFSLENLKIRSLKDITLKTASKIYISENYVLNKKFANETRNAIGSEVQNIDFSNSEDAAKEVNTWVEEHTNKRIKNLVDPDILTENTIALLVNAIYFKGLWDTKFQESLTHDRQFHITKTKTTTVRMMHIKGKFMYTESNELQSQLIKIPYKGGESSLIIVLPKEIDGIKHVEKLLSDPNVLEVALNSMYYPEVELYIPRFKIETTTNLKKILIKMNIKKMFDSRTAKLDKLLEEVKDLYIDAATQKAFIEVNEEGAEAAAANVFGVYHSETFFDKPINFIADHPFLFFLHHGDNTLFSGVYYAD